MRKLLFRRSLVGLLKIEFYYSKFVLVGNLNRSFYNFPNSFHKRKKNLPFITYFFINTSKITNKIKKLQN